ncbi:MAG: response regulator transcription factor [Chthoniobacterales bacterium]
MPYRVLVVEDRLFEFPALAQALSRRGYIPERAANAEESLCKYARCPFDLVIIAGDSRDNAVCRQLRASGLEEPVIILSSQASPEEKMRGLSHGADDYVGNPFHAGELLARIQALLRRTLSRKLRSLSEARFGGVHINFAAGTAQKHGRPVNLSSKELQLLRFLIAREPSVVSREELLRDVWGYRAGGTRTVDVHIAAVRRKLEDNPQAPRHILTERGEGYRFYAGSDGGL